MFRMPTTDLGMLFEVLGEQGYRIIGPTVRDGAIVYDTVARPDDLPRGWTDRQGPGTYRLARDERDLYFGHTVGPHSWKSFLFPAREPLVTLRRRTDTIDVRRPPIPTERVAFLGVRACDLAAMGTLDRVFTEGAHVDPRYATRRTSALVIGVDCLEPGQTCFCDSTDTGPDVRGGFDLRLTELEDCFLCQAGTPAGRSILEAMQIHDEASVAERRAAQDALARARTQMGRKLDRRGLAERLFSNLDHPRWDDVAQRCLSCGNCTQVCPTCFCHGIDDGSTPGVDDATRTRRWESCFTDDHAEIHGAPIRSNIRSRYRQWLTHKLSTWIAQFGVEGCVGCGRCITWCPVGIDLTAEAAAISSDAPRVALPDYDPPAGLAGDPMLAVSATVTAVRRESHDVFTLFVEPPGSFSWTPGQFDMVGLPGVGEPPISIAGQSGSALLHTIRAVGAATRAVVELLPGSPVTLRGPFGRGWPLERARGRDVTVIAGGIGLAPLRGALLHMLRAPASFPVVRLLYGARSPSEILYDDELLEWRERYPQFGLGVTVDHATDEWTGHVGVVTNLMRREHLPRHGVYFVCGPEAMMSFVVARLRDVGASTSDIYLSMERNMQCAVGMCGRCQYGPHLVCRDGPVFSYDRIEHVFHQEGF